MVVAVMASALQYDTKPGLGPIQQPGVREADPGRWTLIMIVHPDCPCTKASLRNLAAILDATRLPVRAEIVGAMPPGYEGPKKNLAMARGIVKSELVIMDADRALQTYGARTSGHLFVYDPDQDLVYSGGLTPARGAEDAMSSMRWFKALVHQGAIASSAPTFGCSLRSATGEREG
ncbi:MAG: hypothetical protein H3C58_03300 [Fimbriimonadaceae bacterium]|nr:hypothetical protein [Fimbriimonadaceae bacterium]